MKALPLEDVRVPRHTSSGGTSSATVYVPGAPGDAEVMAPFTLNVTDGTVTVPSPLKRISSTMALGIAAAPGGVTNPVAENT